MEKAGAAPGSGDTATWFTVDSEMGDGWGRGRGEEWGIASGGWSSTGSGSISSPARGMTVASVYRAMERTERYDSRQCAPDSYM